MVFLVNLDDFVWVLNSKTTIEFHHRIQKLDDKNLMLNPSS